MPNPISEETLRALSDALLNDRKIEAIKIYREFSGTGLKEAKEEVERIEESLRAKFPEKFKVEKSGGCAGALVLLASLGALLFLWLVPLSP